MNWQAFRNKLVNQYHEQPQATARIDRALGLLREGLAELGSLGHIHHLAPGPEPQRSEWPKLLYNLEKAPRGYLCLCQEDRKLLGPGWFETLDEAKHADGMGEQFHGRGGIIPTSGLPSVPEGSELSELDKRRRSGLVGPDGYLL